MVNPAGVVGLEFFSVNDSNEYNVHFSASVDGGQTFSKPVRVSDGTSKEVPFGKIPRELGGDQIYADAASDGSFRLVWTDNRDKDNFYRIFHRRVTVAGAPD